MKRESREEPATPELDEVLEQLRNREPIFHRPEFGASRADFEKMMAPDFWEVGASGRLYNREQVLDELERRRGNPPPDLWTVTDFRCRALGSETYLVTYTLLENEMRRTRRTTLWRRNRDGWQIVFHQGTLAPELQGAAF